MIPPRHLISRNSQGIKRNHCEQKTLLSGNSKAFRGQNPVISSYATHTLPSMLEGPKFSSLYLTINSDETDAKSASQNKLLVQCSSLMPELPRAGRFPDSPVLCVGSRGSWPAVVGQGPRAERCLLRLRCPPLWARETLTSIPDNSDASSRMAPSSRWRPQAPGTALGPHYPKAGSVEDVGRAWQEQLSMAPLWLEITCGNKVTFTSDSDEGPKPNVSLAFRAKGISRNMWRIGKTTPD